MGKKRGHLYIQIGYDELAESSGLAKYYIGIIKKMFSRHADFEDKQRKDNQIYSHFIIRIW